jgi:peptidyl-dipeptidase Dcp
VVGHPDGGCLGRLHRGRRPYDKVVAKLLRSNVLSVGNRVGPAEAYKAFRGREAGIGALMRKRGFPEPGTDAALAH